MDEDAPIKDPQEPGMSDASLPEKKVLIPNAASTCELS